MSAQLFHRSFTKLEDFTAEEIRSLINLAKTLKAEKSISAEHQRLQGKNIALIFEKESTRTRCAFEVAAYDQGAHVTYLGPVGSHIGVKETMKDTARVLGRMYDGIEYRGFDQSKVEELARHSGVPVWNGLTQQYHPTQVLADFLTMLEFSNKPLKEISFGYVGNAANNVTDSLLIGAAKLGMSITVASPRTLWPDEELTKKCQSIAKESDANILITDDLDEAIKNADFIYTDVWVSMGESKKVWKERIDLLMPFQVNSALLQQCGNLNVKFMHCLPAFHNRDTEVGEKIYRDYGLEAMEVTEEVFESDASVVFDQAENRLHTIKAIMVATLNQ